MKKLITTIHLRKGFTLVETLVAITILTTAIAAALTAAGSGLQSSIYARDQITAYYLAEEAIEYIRNLRDSNFNKQIAWLDGIPEACFTGDFCRIDVPANTIDSVSDEADLRMWFNPDIESDAGGYTYVEDGANVHSKFTRKITIQKIGDQDSATEILITVVMEWRSGSFDKRSFTMREALFNWRAQDIIGPTTPFDEE